MPRLLHLVCYYPYTRMIPNQEKILRGNLPDILIVINKMCLTLQANNFEL